LLLPGTTLSRPSPGHLHRHLWLLVSSRSSTMSWFPVAGLLLAFWTLGRITRDIKDLQMSSADTLRIVGRLHSQLLRDGIL
jgi:hypothetical protein